jgi:predicted nuclease of predicted toxin-antitoxin system
MQVLLDEHVPIQMIDLLGLLLRGHDVEHVNTIKWRGKQDKNLIIDAAGKGFDIFITNDRDQLNDPGELKVIKKAGIHHVRYAQRTNLRLRGLASLWARSPLRCRW